MLVAIPAEEVTSAPSENPPYIIPPEPARKVVDEVPLVEPIVIVFDPRPVPTLIMLVVASVAKFTGPPLIVAPAKVSVCVVPDPPKLSPVDPPENVKDDDTSGPPVLPEMLIVIDPPLVDPNLPVIGSITT